MRRRRVGASTIAAVVGAASLIGAGVAETADKPSFTVQGQPIAPKTLAHKRPSGKPCLEFEAISRVTPAAPGRYDHIVGVTNTCLAHIDIKLCYFHSEECTDVSVGGLDYKEVMLGSRALEQNFSYNYEEK